MMEMSKKVLLVLCVIVLMVPSLGMASDWMPGYFSFINNSNNDVSTLYEYFTNEKENLLKSQENYEEAFSVSATSAAYRNKSLYSPLLPGKTYIFFLEDNRVREGSPSVIHVSTYDFENTLRLERRSMVPDKHEVQAWIFSVPTNASSTQVELLLYAGKIGETNGVSVRFQHASLYEWDENGQEASLADNLR